nr:hypothetical protein [Acidobacteriota bacterium]
PEAEALGFVEHPTQAENRYKRQEGAWNLVWWKRVFYSISVVVFALLALFPFYDKPTRGWEEPLSLLSRGIGLLSTFLPDFLGGWIKAYQRHPGVFGILALLFLLLLSIGSKLRLRIFDRMRLLWSPTSKWPEVVEPDADLPNSALFSLRTNPLYQGLAKFFKKKALPLLAGVVVVVVVLAVAAARGVYRVADSFGCFCPPTTNYSSVFRNSDPCWASGLRVEEGKRYRITISANANEPWKDGTTEPKNIGGFGTELMTSAMYLGLPFRRQFRAPWFKPIARIGRKGGDEYPLDGMIENDTKLTVEIKARRSGDLFLYLNDAVSLFPWTRFYDNNRGSAEVNVTCLDCNGSPTQ